MLACQQLLYRTELQLVLTCECSVLMMRCTDVSSCAELRPRLRMKRNIRQLRLKRVFYPSRDVIIYYFLFEHRVHGSFGGVDVHIARSRLSGLILGFFTLLIIKAFPFY